MLKTLSVRRMINQLVTPRFRSQWIVFLLNIKPINDLNAVFIGIKA
jgi:hypothetical protein